VGVKTKIRFDLKERVIKIRRDFNRTACLVYKAEIIDNILSGISPVKGQKRYAKYTEGYKNVIRKGKVRSRKKRVRGKSISPVNLQATGTLLKSFVCKIRRDRIRIAFTDFVAEFHNVTGPRGRKDKIRRMLPTKPKEQFNQSITIKIQREINKIVRRRTKK